MATKGSDKRLLLSSDGEIHIFLMGFSFEWFLFYENFDLLLKERSRWEAKKQCIRKKQSGSAVGWKPKKTFPSKYREKGLF